TPHTLHPTPHTPHPTPHTLHPTPHYPTTPLPHLPTSPHPTPPLPRLIEYNRVFSKSDQLLALISPSVRI
ncbi:hypothetical protein, partial [Microcystis sp. LE19-195.1E]|uniref:hypothetical protein n=1 Tax=Microcystis sp. LE19-195.1E TaxID=3016440 RepID=UPI00258990CF